MKNNSVGLLELETAVLECFLEKTPLSPLGVKIKILHSTLNCAFRWIRANFSTFHTIQILIVIVKKLILTFYCHVVLINKYSLIYTCWTLIAWEGICTVLARAC
jgi:hypothetical protein